MEYAPRPVSKRAVIAFPLIVLVLVSLLAISFIGDHFGWALALALAGGALIGLLA